MKKFIATIMLGLAVSIAAPAQEQEDVRHHEIYAGVGLLNTNQMFSMVGDLFATIFTFGQLVEPDKYWILTPSVGYRYWFNKRVGIGAHLAFDKNSVKALYINPSGANEWRIHNRFFCTFAMDFNWNYMNKSACQLYGNVGMGVSIVSFSNNKTTNSEARLKQIPFFNMHVSPFGVRIGKTFAGFAEVGWGYKGFINAGLSIKL